MSRPWLLFMAVCLCLGPGRVHGQFLDAAAAPGGPGLGEFTPQRYRVGVVVTAEGGPCAGIYATLPVPDDWPEQTLCRLRRRERRRDNEPVSHPRGSR